MRNARAHANIRGVLTFYGNLVGGIFLCVLLRFCCFTAELNTKVLIKYA
jgi:hypothetical protein